MKTAISIPDELFSRADSTAERLGKTRSELYREALANYLDQLEPRATTAALDELADEINADRSEFERGAARQALERSEW